MRLLIYTDLQATEGADRCRHDPSLPLQRYRVARFYAELARIAKAEQCTHLCDLGDTTDDRAFVYRATLDVVTDGLEKVTKACPKGGFIKLTGNHEQLLKDGKIAAEGLFRPYFQHVGDGVVSTGTGCTFVFRSYTDDYEKLNQDLAGTVKTIRVENLKERIVLFAHGDVKGARYASGETCDQGISLATLDLFDAAFLGHVHNHQMLLKDKAWFVGSPFQQDFGEAAQRKFVAILDITDRKASISFVEVKGFPEYRTVSLKDFLEVAKLDEEHRYKVLLNSIEETELFYTNPLSELGEARLTYAESSPAKSAEGETPELTEDPRLLISRFVQTRPLTGLPEEIGHEDLVNLAMNFVGED